MGKCS